MMRVLIVDDSKFMRLTLKNILRRNEIKIVGEAESDREAVEKYKKLKPDLVIMDIVMPVQSGLKAVGEICKLNHDAKIIMVSAMGQEAIMEESMKLGAKAFVVKPVKQEELLDVISKVMEE